MCIATYTHRREFILLYIRWELFLFPPTVVYMQLQSRTFANPAQEAQPQFVRRGRASSRGPEMCTECNAVLPSVTKLQMHMARAHPELHLKPAVCDRCGKRYTYEYTLHRHRWKCLGLRQLQCDVCGHVSHRLDYHKAHLLKMHGITS